MHVFEGKVGMLKTLVSFLERLNLSYPQGFVGLYFMEILALLSIIFGGSLMLLSWKNKRYYLGVLGLLVGGWGGLMLKGIYAPAGWLAPFMYLMVGAGLGCFVAVNFERFVGILLGGFAVACLSYVFFPGFFSAGHETYLALSVAFLFGGGLGAIFPRFFFIFNSSLIGTAFVTFGVSVLIVRPLDLASTHESSVLVHTLVFLPLFVASLVYQVSKPDEEAKEGKPASRTGKKAETSGAAA